MSEFCQINSNNCCSRSLPPKCPDACPREIHACERCIYLVDKPLTGVYLTNIILIGMICSRHTSHRLVSHRYTCSRRASHRHTSFTGMPLSQAHISQACIAEAAVPKPLYPNIVPDQEAPSTPRPSFVYPYDTPPVCPPIHPGLSPWHRCNAITARSTNVADNVTA